MEEKLLINKLIDEIKNLKNKKRELRIKYDEILVIINQVFLKKFLVI
jgi:hypothetical protein